MTNTHILSLLADVTGRTDKVITTSERHDPGLKYTIALRNGASRTGEEGPNAHYLSSCASLPMRFISMYLIGERAYLTKLQALVESTRADIIHTFQSPDDLGYLAKSTSLPVIHEVFDMVSLYDSQTYALPQNDNLLSPLQMLSRSFIRNREVAWERFVHENCDALVYTSEYMLEIAKETYSDFRAIVVPNAVRMADIPPTQLPKLSSNDGHIHAVYVGRIETKPGHRNIIPMLQDLATKGIRVHVYPLLHPSIRETVERTIDSDPRMTLHEPVSQRTLLKELTRYDIGLVLLAPANERLLNVAVPNKLYEYLASGLPIAVSPYKSLMDIVKRWNCGVVLRNPYDLADIRDRTIPFRKEFTIDHYIGRLLRLYEELT